METIGKRIRLLRRSQHMNQAEFAQQIGLKQGMVSLWETDKNINERTIKAICYTFSVSENWLKDGIGEPFTDSDPPNITMKGIHERIQELRRLLDIKQGDFAKALGLTNAAVSRIESGKNPLTESNLRLVCYTFGVNEEWLRNGIGEPFTDDDPPKEENYLINEVEMLDIYHELLPPVQKDILKYARNMLDLQKLRNVNPTDEPPDSA